MKVGRCIIVITILLIALIPPLITNMEADEQKPVRINVESHIKIMESGFVHRVDNVSFLNHQELTMSNIIFRPSVSGISNLFSIGAKVNGKKVTCELAHELGVLKPSFKIKSEDGEILELAVSYTLINQYDYINQSTLNFSIPIYPTIQIDGKNIEVQSFNMAISIPRELTLDTTSVHVPSAEWTFKESENILYINSTSTTINDKIVFFNLIGEIKQIICPYLEETLEISSTKVRLSTIISVQNKGSNEVREIQIEIPRNAEDVKVSDIMGDIKLDMDLKKVYLRYPLLKNYNYTFMVSCTLPTPDFKNNSEVKISIPHFVLYPIINANITLIFPNYADTKPEYPLPLVMQSFPELTIFKYKLVNITAYDPETLVITYSEPAIHVNIVSVLRSLSILLIILLLVTFYLLSKRRMYIHLKPVPEHINIVEKLCSKYEEKISLIDELVSIGDKFIEGEIKKKLYIQRTNTIRNDLTRLDMEIRELKSMMEAKHLHKINELETELTKLLHILESIENYRKQLLLKRIKRGIYDELTLSSKKQFRKSYAKILSLIKSLRED